MLVIDIDPRDFSVLTVHEKRNASGHLISAGPLEWKRPPSSIAFPRRRIGTIAVVTKYPVSQAEIFEIKNIVRNSYRWAGIKLNAVSASGKRRTFDIKTVRAENATLICADFEVPRSPTGFMGVRRVRQRIIDRILALP